ncbi:hypothetical protein M271_11825 [Streptomyces rapamycinicus NRRL 5491]|nr:hypothetical protein M271_11825 [Streptomyces rapamycinicus NRRL 5491]
MDIALHGDLHPAQRLLREAHLTADTLHLRR